MSKSKMVFVVALLAGVVLSKAASAGTTWSASGASCVPVGTTGVNVSAGAVTAGAGTTVVLYCAVTKATLNAAFNRIEITYKGNTTTNVNTLAELIELSKPTGLETVKAVVQSTGSSTITSQNNLVNNSTTNFDSNLYYVRITLRSGNISGQLQTIYGVSLIFQ